MTTTKVHQTGKQVSVDGMHCFTSYSFVVFRIFCGCTAMQVSSFWLVRGSFVLFPSLFSLSWFLFSVVVLLCMYFSVGAYIALPLLGTFVVLDVLFCSSHHIFGIVGHSKQCTLPQ